MRIFAVWIKRPNDVAVQCSQHSDARVHDEVAAFSGTDQTTNRGLPFLELLLSLRQARDVVAGIAQPHEVTATGMGSSKGRDQSPCSNEVGVQIAVFFRLA